MDVISTSIWRLWQMFHFYKWSGFVGYKAQSIQQKKKKYSVLFFDFVSEFE